jgi:urea transport system substrate-binding protein
VTLVCDPLYVDLEHPVFTDVFKAISDLTPDVVLNTINGVGNVEFFADTWTRLSHCTSPPEPRTRVMSFSLGDHEVQRVGAEVMEGHYACWSYFATIDGALNSSFLRGMRERMGEFSPSDPAESAYAAVSAFRAAVQIVIDRGDGLITPVSIREAALGLEIDAPSGRLLIEPTNGHVHTIPRIGILGPSGRFDVVWEAPQRVAPDPFPIPNLETQVATIRKKFH